MSTILDKPKQPYIKQLRLSDDLKIQELSKWRVSLSSYHLAYKSKDLLSTIIEIRESTSPLFYSRILVDKNNQLMAWIYAKPSEIDTYWVIKTIIVNPLFKRKGLASLLMEDFESFSIKKHILGCLCIIPSSDFVFPQSLEQKSWFDLIRTTHDQLQKKSIESTSLGFKTEYCYSSSLEFENILQKFLWKHDFHFSGVLPFSYQSGHSGSLWIKIFNK